MRKFLSFLLRLSLALVVSMLIWFLFTLLQQFTYANPHQLYLFGTNISNMAIFFFTFVIMLFLFSFRKHRHNPRKLKRRFYTFIVFYLLGSVVILLSFDNYLQITRDGIVYNEFFRLGDTQLHTWNEIERVELDYQPNLFSTHSNTDLRLVYTLVFYNGDRIDLNNYNSPLYSAKQFFDIHQALLNRNIYVLIRRPLPPNQNPHSFLYKMYHFSR